MVKPSSRLDTPDRTRTYPGPRGANRGGPFRKVSAKEDALKKIAACHALSEAGVVTTPFRHDRYLFLPRAGFTSAIRRRVSCLKMPRGH